MPHSQAESACKRDDGFSLVELLVAMVVFATLMAFVTGLFIQITYQAKDAMGRADSVQQARLGLSQIDRQVRSGNLIINPASEKLEDSGVNPNYSMRLYTQEGGVAKCVQWRVIDPNGDGYSALEYRTWNPNYPTVPDVTDWSVVANNVVSPTSAIIVADDATTWPPFWLDTSLPTGSIAQNIRITLRMKDPAARLDSKPISISSVVTGRNTVFGYSESSCAQVPSPSTGSTP